MAKNAPRRKLHDQYFKQAKREGYLARSAYKLHEIQEAARLIRPGDRVLDLGCAPGSWLQVASELVGEDGRVIGVDLLPVTHQMPPTVVHGVADVYDLNLPALIEAAGGAFDVVLSDMAPNTSGAPGGVDHFRSVRLCEQVLLVASQVLRPGGSLAMKVFDGETLPDLAKLTKRRFARLRHIKPKATRGVSKEIYLVAAGFRGNDRS